MRKVNYVEPINPISNLVDSICLKEYPSGILSFMINTKDKWVEYRIESIGSITIYQDDSETETITIKDDRLNGEFKIFDKQEKDQIIIYYIPINLFKHTESSATVSIYTYPNSNDYGMEK